MGWTKALFGRLTIWPSKKSSSESSSFSYPPVFAVDRTEVAVATATGVPELTLSELNKATRCFSAAMVIGGGRRATVYRATALSRLRHENILHLLGYTIDATAGVRVLLFEFAHMGTLHDALHGPPTGEPAAAEPSSSSSRPALSWAQRTSIALDVARGLEYLHDAAATSHWGITSTNVLLFQGFRAKIADYDVFMRRPPNEGEARNARRLDTAEMEKAWYLPPEYQMTGCKTSPKFDVYSYGVLLLELLTASYRWSSLR